MVGLLGISEVLGGGVILFVWEYIFFFFGDLRWWLDFVFVVVGWCFFGKGVVLSFSVVVNFVSFGFLRFFLILRVIYF